MRKKLIKIIATGAIIVSLLSLFGCSSNKYKVDYCGAKYCYIGAKDAYRAGKEVVLYFELVATDTDYSFKLDGESLNFTYDPQKGFILRFTMPEHDIKLECISRNSMTYIPDTQ